MRRKNYDDKEENNDGRARWDSRPPPPFWDDDDDDDNDTDNDEDVKGLCFQRMHARHQCCAEAVLALQPRDGGRERMLFQAHHVAPRAGEWGQGQIGQGGDTRAITTTTGTTTTTHTHTTIT